MQQIASMCAVLKKNPFFHGFIILYFKALTTQIVGPISKMQQNAPFCVVLKKNSDPPPTAFSLSRVGMHVCTQQSGYENDKEIVI